MTEHASGTGARRRRRAAAGARRAVRLRPAPGTVAIRLYGQGLGDCFLLAFPRTDGSPDPCYVVIDCGIAKGTPEEKERMGAVVADIAGATGGTIDVLAITHEHYDHISGFSHAQAAWEAMTIRALWLPWTEKPGDREAGGLREQRRKLNLAASQAIERTLRAVNPEDLGALRVQSGFLGVDPEDAEAMAAAHAEFAAGRSVMDRAMEIARSLCPAAQHVFCEPGEVRRIPGTAFHAYVLGPPRGRNKAGEELKNERGRPLVKLLEDEEEMYGYRDLQGNAETRPGRQMALGASPSRDALAQALAGSDPNSDEYDRYCPFDSSLRLSWDEAMVQEFFWEHYTSGPDWRRVDDDWLGGAPDMALRAGGITNNISLVLAFEMPNSRNVLLFPGDAQVGNWLSWHHIGQWETKGDAAALASKKADMEEFLGRVVFYKVGHHGSHNATVRERGLELMARSRDGEERDLIAFVPVSVPVAHDIMNYCPMPFYPVMRRLQEKTRGRVYLANGERLEPPLDGTEPAPEEPVIARSQSVLGPKVYRGQTIEGEVPLWIQFTLNDPAPPRPGR